MSRLTRLEQHAVAGGAAVAEKRVDFSYKARSQFAQITRYAALAGTANDEVFATRYAYDGNARLANLSHVADGVELAGYAYTWDKADRITRLDYSSLVAGSSSSTFSYDNGSQLTAADHTDQTDEAYQYDTNGNRVTANGASYSTGANDQLLSDGVFNYTYDLEGNRLTRTRISTAPADDHLVEYTWDHRNRLTAVTFKNNSGTVTKRVENDYDLYQRWIGQRLDADGDGDMDSSRSFVYDEFQIVLAFADLDGPGPAGSSLTNRYLWGRAVDQLLADEVIDASPGQAADILWAATDHLNTVRDQLSFDPAGNSGTGLTTIANHRDYDSFGNVVSETNAAVDSLFGFTGRAYDEHSGQQNNLNRWYDALTGRWLSEDPIQDDYRNVTRYVANQPVTQIDTLGLFAITIEFKAFIPKSKGAFIPKSMFIDTPSDVNWAVEPGSFRDPVYIFATDDREKSGQPGSSRLSLTGSFESTELGSLGALGTKYFQALTGHSHQMKSWSQNGIHNYVVGSFKTAKAEPKLTEELREPACLRASSFEVSASAAYPFNRFSPTIDIDAVVLAREHCDRSVSLVLIGAHDAFPAYEIKVNGTVVYESYPSDAGPGLLNLGFWRDGFSVVIEIGQDGTVRKR